MQAVALGAAVQAGILEGQVSDVMVLDVWQANLMRAFAKQRLQEDLAASTAPDDDDDAFSEEVRMRSLQNSLALLDWDVQVACAFHMTS